MTRINCFGIDGTQCTSTASPCHALRGTSMTSRPRVGMGALSTSGAKVVMAGNPTRTSGLFFFTHPPLPDRCPTMHLNCLAVPRAQGHIDDIKAKYGENSN